MMLDLLKSAAARHPAPMSMADIWLPVPPFARLTPIAQPGEASGCPATEADDDIFALIRAERVGGAFWADTPDLHRPPTDVVVLPSDVGQAQTLWENVRPAVPATSTLVVFPGDFLPPDLVAEVARHGCRLIARDFDPHPLLADRPAVWCVGLAPLAVIGAAHGCEIRSVGEGDVRHLDSDAARSVICEQTQYVSPLTGDRWSAWDAVRFLGAWRRQMDESRQIAVCAGVSWWKRRQIGAFLGQPSGAARFRRTTRGAVRRAEEQGGDIAAWSSRLRPALRRTAARHAIRLRLIEDGFIRSAGLGSDFLPPSSIVVDSRGIYFDPTRPSDLEHLLATAEIDDRLRQRARVLREQLIRSGITKYGAGRAQALPPVAAGARGKTVILVPGQVGDDLSIRLGAPDRGGNAGLLRRVREGNPRAWIVYRPHPDVDAGHRAGALSEGEVLVYADEIRRDGAMSEWIERCDELHTMTSLAGFEALMRGRRVVTYGQPFYAGWGLTRDTVLPFPRRGRVRSLDELVAATLLLYPLYLDPVTRLPCSPEVLITRFQDPDLWRASAVVRVRRLQGRLRRGLARLTAFMPALVWSRT